MDGVDATHGAKVKLPLAAMIHRMRVLHPFFSQPFRYFESGHHGGAGLFCQLFAVGRMVGVAMRNQDVIGCNIFELHILRQFIRGDKGIEKQLLPGQLHSKAGMSVVREFHNCRLGMPTKVRLCPDAVFTTYAQSVIKNEELRMKNGWSSSCDSFIRRHL